MRMTPSSLQRFCPPQVPQNRGEPYDPANHESVTTAAVEACASRMVCDEPTPHPAVKFVTDTVTGSSKEVLAITDTRTGTVNLYIDGAPYALADNEVVQDYVVPVRLNVPSTAFSIAPAATLSPLPSILTAATFARLNVDGGDVLVSFGMVPVLGQSRTIQDKKTWTLETREEILSVQLKASDPLVTVKGEIEYFNTNPDADKT